jgi:hypothetical protein
MKLGCFGCFFLTLGILAIVVLGGGALFLSLSLAEAPKVNLISYSKGDGYSAQQKLYEVVLRQSGRSSRTDPIVLSEREANAFLSRHLAEAAGVPLSPLVVRFERGLLFAQGQTPLRNLFQGPPFAQLLPYFPDKRLDQPVWVTVRARISVEDSGVSANRYGTVTVTDLELGRQPVSSSLLYVLMGPSGAGLFRWRVPAVVESIQIEEGKAIIQTRGAAR